MNSFKLEIKSAGDWYDVSDFVTDKIPFTPVPTIDRNVNYETLSSGFSCGVSAAFNGVDASGETFHNSILAAATHAKFSVDGVERFLGIIHKTEKSYTVRTYKYTILNAISVMQDFFIDSATLNTAITASGGYIASDNNSLPNIRFQSLLEILFEVSGLDDLAEVEVNTSDITSALIAENKQFNSFK